MRCIRKAALITTGLLLAIYFARNEILSCYFYYIYSHGKSYKIKLTEPYISLIPPSLEFRQIEISDIKSKQSIFIMERFRLEGQWQINNGKLLKIKKITAHIRRWQIIRESNGLCNLDWITALVNKYNWPLNIDELNLSARGVSFIDYVFNEDGLLTKQPLGNIESITLYTLNGNILQLAARIFPKIWFEIPFSIKNIANVNAPRFYQNLKNKEIRLYTDKAL